MKKLVKGLILTVIVFFLYAGLACKSDSYAADSVLLPLKIQYSQNEARKEFEMVNSFRTGEEAWYWNENNTEKIYVTGLSELNYDYNLEKVAMQRAVEIALYYSHSRADGKTCWATYSDLGYQPSTAGENIAYGFSCAEFVFDAWREDDCEYKDQGHRRNMLSSSYTNCGFGCVYYEGCFYWVQEFSGNSSTASYTETTARTDPATGYASTYATDLDTLTFSGIPSIEKGDTVNLNNVSVYVKVGKNNKKISSTFSEWESSKTDIISVSGNTATGIKSGKAVLTGVITIDGITKNVSKETEVVQSKLILSSETLNFDRPEGYEQLNVSVYPENSKYTADNLVWSISDDSIAALTGYGNLYRWVYPVTYGTTTVTVKTSDGALTASCKVNIKNALKSVYIYSWSPSLTEGVSSQFKYTYSPTDTTDDTSAKWTSSNEKVATVSEDGTVTAVSEGTADITVTIGKLSSTRTVEVRSLKVSYIQIQNLKSRLKAGETNKCTAVYYPMNATGDKTCKWTSSDTSVATVYKDGTVTALKAGETTITAEIQGKTDSFTLTVYEETSEKVSYIQIQNSKNSLKVGETNKCTVFYYPMDAAGDTTCKWTSSDISVAKVDKDGTVTALKTGETTITADIQGKTDSFKLTVYEETSEKGSDTVDGNNNNSDNNGSKKTNPYEEYGLSDKYVPEDYEDKSGSAMIIVGKDLSWNDSNSRSYWYENGIKQGTYYDPQGVIGDGTNRGREICDNNILDVNGNGTWFWLDACYDGAKAVGKEVWIPYIYQDEDNWDLEKKKDIAYESDSGMEELVFSFIIEKKGKWVRYDEEGRMLKGWVTIEGALAEKYPNQIGNTYYYDTRTGLMAKGRITIGGVEHYFDENTGVMLY